MYAIEIKQLCKKYANRVEALKGIDLTIKKGDFFALLGVNGAGKSTTIGLIMTLLRKTSGSIRIYGYDLDRQPELAKSYLGFVPQEFNLNIFEKCEQVLLNQAGLYGVSPSIARPRIEYLLHELGLWEKKNALVRYLSGGMKRRLMIARALIHQPKVLILDEPTAGIDIEIRRSMWDFLNRINLEGTTLLLTTHYLEEAERLCKKIAIIDQGRIVVNTSMKALLESIHYQSFIFNTKKPFDQLPDFSPCIVTILDKNSFELRIDNNQISLNEIFALFTQYGLEIQGMRNKNNRLEELFWDLIKHD